MFTKIRIKLVAVATALACAALPCTACGGGGSASAQDASTPPTSIAGPACSGTPTAKPDSTPLVIVTATRRNSPPIGLLPSGLCTMISAAAAGSAPISLIRLDGRPAQVGTNAEFSSAAANPSALDADMDDFVQGIAEAITSVQAETPDVDIRQALSVAADAAHGGNAATRGNIVVLGSTLQETGTPDFTQRGMIDADPAEIAAFVDSQHLTPDLTNITVTFIGAGTTMAPQAQLDTAHANHLQDVWRAISQHGHVASVNFLPATGTTSTGPFPPAGSNLPTVRNVAIPAAPTWNPHQIYPNSGPLGFQPDRDVLLDRAGAAVALAPVPNWLAANPTCRLQITGTTARVGDQAGQVQLGNARGSTVRALIGELGGDVSRIDVVGVGSYFTDYVLDHDPATGVLLPDKAQLNRTVRFTPVCGGGSTS